MDGGKSFSSVRDAQVDSSDLHDEYDDDYEDGSSEDDDFDETSDDDDDDVSYQEDEDIENEIGNHREMGKKQIEALLSGILNAKLTNLSI